MSLKNEARLSLKSSQRPSKLRLVRPTPGLTPSRGFLNLGPRHVPCVIGAAGAVWRKKEGDLATPRGTYSFVLGRYRSDRLVKTMSLRSLTPTKPNEVWCDDPQSFQYNRLRFAPAKYRHERLWLDAGTYDIVLALDHNRRPRRLGGGSAIFFHLSIDFSPTSGCIAVSLSQMRKILAQVSRNAKLQI